MRYRKVNKKFWDREYTKNNFTTNLAVSTKPSGDLVKFLHWLDKQQNKQVVEGSLGAGSRVYDIGCGNGRNLIYLAKEFNMVGGGFDISEEAIDLAQKMAKENGIELGFSVKSMDGTIDMLENSVDLVLDMMASHFLNAKQRQKQLLEIVRVLKPGGWLFYKTFLLDEDRNAKKLLREHPAGEDNTYIHPKMNVAEHVSTEREVRELYSKHFTLHKVLKSHNHLKNGRANKRRSISVYAQKLE